MEASIISTVIYYYSATGNSLYVAKFLQSQIPDTEIRSIAKELLSENISVNADCVGFVFPLHYLSLSIQVEEFLDRLTIHESPYIFAIATCGIPYWGRPFLDTNEILAKKNHKIQGAWFVRLVSNYLPYRDTAADWRIGIRAWLAERKLQGICEGIKRRENHETWEIFVDSCKKHHDNWKDNIAKIDEVFICDKGKCTSCGLCERVCPRENIKRPAGLPVWRHNCVECLGCLHICPVQAVDYGEITKGRHRYRHKEIKPIELLNR